jgi:hypothetical protein
MRVKIIAFGHFTTDTNFRIEGGTEGRELKVGDVVGYLDPQTMEMVGYPESASLWSSRCRWMIPSLRNCAPSPTIGRNRS